MDTVAVTWARHTSTRRCSLAAAVIAFAAAGCSSPSAAPTPAPSPTPTWSCTPQSSVDPPCTEARAKEQAQLNANYAASEKALRDFTAEWNRIGIAGRGKIPSPLMTENAAGPFLKLFTGYLAEVEREGVRWTTGSKIVYVRREPDLKRASSPATELALAVCEDGSGNRVVDGKGRVVAKGIVVGATVWARPVGGRMKIWDADGKEVKSCAS